MTVLPPVSKCSFERSRAPCPTETKKEAPAWKTQSSLHQLFTIFHTPSVEPIFPVQENGKGLLFSSLQKTWNFVQDRTFCYLYFSLHILFFCQKRSPCLLPFPSQRPLRTFECLVAPASPATEESHRGRPICTNTNQLSRSTAFQGVFKRARVLDLFPGTLPLFFRRSSSPRGFPRKWGEYPSDTQKSPLLLQTRTSQADQSPNCQTSRTRSPRSKTRQPPPETRTRTWTWQSVQQTPANSE